MSRPTHTVERAYEIARSGRCVELRDVRRQLLREGYEGVEAHLAGSSIRRELQALIKASRLPGAAGA